MLLGVPVVAILFFIIRLIASEKLKSKNMPVETDKYIPEGIYSDNLDEHKTDE